MSGKTLAAVLLFALLVRGGVLLFTPDALAADPDGYRRLAENIVRHGVFGHGATPTAYRPPLYPLLLTGCVVVGDYCRVAIGVLHLLLGTAAVGLVFVLGNWWGLSRRGSAIAALLVVCDPILLFQSTQIMTETAATLLAVAGLAALTWAVSLTPRDCVRGGKNDAILSHDRSRGAFDFFRMEFLTVNKRRAVLPATLTGVILALGALCRPTLLPWTIAAGVVLFLLHLQKNRRGLTAPGGIAHRLRLPAAFALGAAVVLCPWMIRNQMQFGRPIATTTHGGYTLLLANNPEFYKWLRSGSWGSVWRPDDPVWEDHHRQNDELQADRLAYAKAWQTILNEPGTFAYSCLVRLGRFWSPLPHRVDANESPARRLSRYAVAVWYVLEYLLTAVGVWRVFANWPLKRPALGISPSAGWLWGLLLVACLTAVHAVFWTDMRMRAVVMPMVALAAAAGVFRSNRK